MDPQSMAYLLRAERVGSLQILKPHSWTVFQAYSCMWIHNLWLSGQFSEGFSTQGQGGCWCWNCFYTQVSSTVYQNCNKDQVYILLQYFVYSSEFSGKSWQSWVQNSLTSKLKAITDNRKWAFFLKPVPTQWHLLTPLGNKPFENTVGKGEIARNEHFLLFPQCFQPVWITFFHFHQIWNCHLQTLSVWKSLKFVVW